MDHHFRLAEPEPDGYDPYVVDLLVDKANTAQQLGGATGELVQETRLPTWPAGYPRAAVDALVRALAEPAAQHPPAPLWESPTLTAWLEILPDTSTTSPIVGYGGIVGRARWLDMDERDCAVASIRRRRRLVIEDAARRPALGVTSYKRRNMHADLTGWTVFDPGGAELGRIRSGPYRVVSTATQLIIDGAVIADVSRHDDRWTVVHRAGGLIATIDRTELKEPPILRALRAERRLRRSPHLDRNLPQVRFTISIEPAVPQQVRGLLLALVYGALNLPGAGDSSWTAAIGT